MKLSSEKNSYHENIEFFGEYLDVKLSEDSLVKLKREVNESLKVFTKPLTADEQKKYIRYMFDVGTNWHCPKCHNKNLYKKSPIECESCHAFKPLELYPSVFKNRKKISEKEADQLEERRQIEKLRINQHDNYRHGKNECWYVIDSAWIYDWRMFIENNRNLLAMGSKKADTEGVGVLDPGPISNNNLFDESGLLKQDLEMAKDYRLVKQSVWLELFEIYGGGPPIKRSHPDIYSEELSVEEEVKLANKKLRKFKRDDRK